MHGAGKKVSRALSWWVGRVCRAPGLALLLGAALTVFLGGYTARSLGVDTDTTEMFSPELPFRRDHEAFKADFPQFTDTLLVVVDAPSGPQARRAAAAVAAGIGREPLLFPERFLASAEPFFREHGLLYLAPEEIRGLVDQLKLAAPLLNHLRANPRLDALAGSLGQAVALGGARLPPPFFTVLDGLAAAVEAAREGRSEAFPWEEAFFVAGEPGPGREVIVTRPRLDYTSMLPGARAIERMRAIVAASGVERDGVRVRLSGEVALAHEELETASRGAVISGLITLLLIVVLLRLALRSVRLTVACLLTLLIGLVWTAGFAAVTVGHLNLISVAFAVLYLSVGVAFSIHFCLRAEEFTLQGMNRAAALETAAGDVGLSLFLAALTTSLGFLAFVPTDFIGVAELGVIAGGGVLISLAATLSILPAFLCRGLLRLPARPPGQRALGAPGADLLTLLLGRARLVRRGALVIGLLAVMTVPLARFDPNPLELRDPESESVRAFEALADDPATTPYRVSAVVDDDRRLPAVKAALAQLEPVAAAISIDDLVPREQAGKRAMLAELAPLLRLESGGAADPLPAEETLAALADLRAALAPLAGAEGRPAAARLERALDALLADLPERSPAAGAAVLERLEAAVLGGLMQQIDALAAALQTGEVGIEDLPPALRDRWVTAEGRYRVEALPAENLGEQSALQRFADAVREVAPHATGSPVILADAGQSVVAALRSAFLYAFAAITLLLLLLLRNLHEVVLVMAPLLLAGALTTAAMVVLGLEFNFANVIALPLLMGMGVDNGIHMVVRYRHGALPDGNILETSTARAVLYSSATTMCGFGSLAFSPHPGAASMGLVLFLGIAALLVATLLVLPALMLRVKPLPPLP